MVQNRQISREGIEAITDYLNSEERKPDYEKWQSPALFLTPYTNAHGNGRLTAKVIHNIWNDICNMAGTGLRRQAITNIDLDSIDFILLVAVEQCEILDSTFLRDGNHQTKTNKQT